MARILSGILIWASIGVAASSAFAGPDPINGAPARNAGGSPVLQVSCTQQAQSWFFGWLLRPKEGNADCAPSSPRVTSVPLILGTGY
jgi:hypothetical protein